MMIHNIDAKAEKRFWSKVNKSGSCWEWTAFKTKTGYGKFPVKKQSWLAHRAAYVIANGSIPSGMCVLHTCDNPSCVNPKHLWAGSQIENIADRDSKGRQRSVSGESHHKSTLTDNDVLRIKDMLCCAVSGTDIARYFNISVSSVSRIKRNQGRWNNGRKR